MIARSRRLPALVLLAAVPVWRPVLLGILISAVVHRTSLRLRGHVELDAARSELVFCTPPRSVATRIHVTGRLSTLSRTALPERVRSKLAGNPGKAYGTPPSLLLVERRPAAAKLVRARQVWAANWEEGERALHRALRLGSRTTASSGAWPGGVVSAPCKKQNSHGDWQGHLECAARHDIDVLARRDIRRSTACG